MNIIFPFYDKERHGFLFSKWWGRLLVVFYMVGIVATLALVYSWIEDTHVSWWSTTVYYYMGSDLKTVVIGAEALPITAIIHYILQLIFFKLVIDFIALGNKKIKQLEDPSKQTIPDAKSKVGWRNITIGTAVLLFALYRGIDLGWFTVGHYSNLSPAAIAGQIMGLDFVLGIACYVIYSGYRIIKKDKKIIITSENVLYSFAVAGAICIIIIILGVAGVFGKKEVKSDDNNINNSVPVLVPVQKLDINGCSFGQCFFNGQCLTLPANSYCNAGSITGWACRDGYFPRGEYCFTPAEMIEGDKLCRKGRGSASYLSGEDSSGNYVCSCAPKYHFEGEVCVAN